MKKSWQLPVGQWPAPSLVKLKWLLDYLLLPFYLLLLALSQWSDVLMFLGLRFTDAINSVLQLLPFNRFSQQQLRSGLNWIVTGGLCIIVTLNLAGLFYDLGRRESLNRWQQTPVTTMIPKFTEVVFTTPTEIQFATEAATIRLSEAQILNLTQQALGLDDANRQSVSQTEALNYALAYYYLGNAQQYQVWLERGRQLDPNSHYFTSRIF